MLVLSRKRGESIVINEEFLLTVLRFTADEAECSLSTTGGELLGNVTISCHSQVEVIPRVRIVLVQTRDDKVRLGIDYPQDMAVHRKEVADALLGSGPVSASGRLPVSRGSPPMRQLAPHLLWLGHAGHVRDMRAVADIGIRALVDLAQNEPIPPIPRDMIYCRFPLIDGAGNDSSLLHAAIHTTADLLRMLVPALLFCSVGLSRSPAIAAAAISIVSRRSPADCLAEIARSIPHDVSPGLWVDVVAALE